MTCVLLFIQSSVCVLCVAICKQMGIISYKDFELDTAKKWFPISSFLVAVIYTGSKSLVSIWPLKASSSILTSPSSNTLTYPSILYSRILLSF
jgi:hypothetical protein